MVNLQNNNDNNTIKSFSEKEYSSINEDNDNIFNDEDNDNNDENDISSYDKNSSKDDEENSYICKNKKKKY